jgi:hypothetical protein
MSGLTRRQLIRLLATGSVAAAGAVVVLARTVLAAGRQEAPAAAPAGPDERADRLAEELAAPEGAEPVSFVNRTVAARGGGAFRNGAFANGRGGGGGAFRNGAFGNGGGGGGAFRNGAFANGRGGGGGAFRNGAFRNF